MSSDSRKSNRTSVGVNASTNTVPSSPSGSTTRMISEEEVEQPRVFGFISIMSEDGPEITHVFGIGKKEIRIGRGSQNDIRMNARQFSRHHVTLKITEEAAGLQVQLSNQSVQKNATRVLPYVLPQGNSVVLDNPSVFLLQGRRFKWMENGGEVDAASIEQSSGQPIVYLLEENKNQPPVNNVVEHSAQKVSSSQKTPSLGGSPASSPKKRRSSLNISLQLRKAAHRHNFRSSLHLMNLSSPGNSIVEEEEDNDTDEDSSQSKSSTNLISFSPDPATASLSPTNPQIIDNKASGNDKSLIDFTSPVPPGSPSASDRNAGMSSPRSNNDLSVSDESASARTSAAQGTRRSLRVSSTENKVSSSDITDPAIEGDESVLGVSLLYRSVEENIISFTTPQALVAADSGSQKKNMDSSPQTPGRRSYRNSVVQSPAKSPMNELNKTASPEKSICPDTSVSSFVTAVSSPINQSVIVKESVKTTPEVSKRMSVQAASPKVSTEVVVTPTTTPQQTSTKSTPSRRSGRVSSAVIGSDLNASIAEDDSVLGISALYRASEDKNTTLISSPMSEHNQTSNSEKLESPKVSTPLVVSSRASRGRRSSKPVPFVVATEKPDSSPKPVPEKRVSKAIVDVDITIPSELFQTPPKSASERRSTRNISEQADTESPSKVLSVNLGQRKSSRTSSVEMTKQKSNSATPTRQSFRRSTAASTGVVDAADISLSTAEDQSALGISGLFNVSEEEDTTLNDSQAGEAASPITVDKSPLSRSSLKRASEGTRPSPKTRTKLNESVHSITDVPVADADSQGDSKASSTPSTPAQSEVVPAVDSPMPKPTAASGKRKSSMFTTNVTIPADLFETPPPVSKGRKSTIKLPTVTRKSSRTSTSMDITIPSGMFSTPLPSSPKVIAEVNAVRLSTSSIGEASALGISALYKSTEAGKGCEEGEGSSESDGGSSNVVTGSARRSTLFNRRSAKPTVAQKSSDVVSSPESSSKSTIANELSTTDEDSSIPLFDSSSSPRFSENASISMEVGAGTPALEKLENLFEKDAKSFSGHRRSSRSTKSDDISIPSELFSTPSPSTPQPRIGRKLTSTPVSANTTMDSPNLSKLYGTPEYNAVDSVEKKSSSRRSRSRASLKETIVQDESSNLNDSTCSLIRPSSRVSTKSTPKNKKSTTPLGSPKDMNESAEFLTANNTPESSPSPARKRSSVRVATPGSPSSSPKVQRGSRVSFDLRKTTLKRNLQVSTKAVFPMDTDSDSIDEEGEVAELGGSLDSSVSLPGTPQGQLEAVSEGTKRSLTPHPRAKKSTLKSSMPLQPVNEDGVSIEEGEGSLSAVSFMSPPPPGSPVRRSSRCIMTSTPAKDSQIHNTLEAVPEGDSVFGLSTLFSGQQQESQIEEVGIPKRSSVSSTKTKPLYYSRKSSTKSGKGRRVQKSTSLLDVTIPEEMFRTPTAVVAKTTVRVSSTPVAEKLEVRTPKKSLVVARVETPEDAAVLELPVEVETDAAAAARDSSTVETPEAVSTPKPKRAARKGKQDAVKEESVHQSDEIVEAPVKKTRKRAPPQTDSQVEAPVIQSLDVAQVETPEAAAAADLELPVEVEADVAPKPKRAARKGKQEVVEETPVQQSDKVAEAPIKKTRKRAPPQTDTQVEAPVSRGRALRGKQAKDTVAADEVVANEQETLVQPPPKKTKGRGTRAKAFEVSGVAPSKKDQLPSSIETAEVVTKIDIAPKKGRKQNVPTLENVEAVNELPDEPSGVELAKLEVPVRKGRAKGRKNPSTLPSEDVPATVAKRPARKGRKVEETVTVEQPVVEAKDALPPKKTRGRTARPVIPVEVTQNLPVEKEMEATTSEAIVETVEASLPPKKGRAPRRKVMSPPPTEPQVEPVSTPKPKRAARKGKQAKATEEAVEQEHTHVEADDQIEVPVVKRARRGAPPQTPVETPAVGQRASKEEASPSSLTDGPKTKRTARKRKAEVVQEDPPTKSPPKKAKGRAVRSKTSKEVVIDQPAVEPEVEEETQTSTEALGNQPTIKKGRAPTRRNQSAKIAPEAETPAGPTNPRGKRTGKQMKVTETPVEPEAGPPAKESRTRKVKVAEPVPEVQSAAPKRLRKKPIEKAVDDSKPAAEDLPVKRTRTQRAKNPPREAEDSSNQPEPAKRATRARGRK